MLRKQGVWLKYILHMSICRHFPSSAFYKWPIQFCYRYPVATLIDILISNVKVENLVYAVNTFVMKWPLISTQLKIKSLINVVYLFPWLDHRMVIFIWILKDL